MFIICSVIVVYSAIINLVLLGNILFEISHVKELLNVKLSLKDIC